MADRPELRVTIAPGRGATERWQRLCLERIHALDHVRVVDAASVAPRDPCDPEATDVIVDLTGDDDAAWPRPPRFGVWQFRFGDGAPFAGGAPGTIARLYRLTGDPDRAIVLREGWFRSRTADAPGTPSVLARVAPWCARVLAQICGGDEAVAAAAPQPTSGCRDARPPSQASGWQKAAVGAFERWIRRERWTVGVVPLGIRGVMERGVLPEPNWIAGQPVDQCYADPFPIARTGDRLEVLIEAYPSRGGPGRIAELALDADARLLDARDRIVAPGQHTSYPFVFRDEGRLMCVPETARQSRVGSYVRDPADGTWRGDGELLVGFAAVDSTLLEHDGRWWLFCTHRDEENQTELHLFCAPAWRGPWTPHPLNPVKSDARSSRPAGACFAIDGAVYRPAQDCSRRYGGAIAINRLVELSDRRFREETVLVLRPSPDSPWPDGMHTINSLDGVTVVDGLRVERVRRRVARNSTVRC